MVNRQTFSQEAFILHHRPYRESSLLIEAFTLSSGRIGLIAKGVRGGRKGSSALLQPFHPLLLSWVQSGEMATLTGVEPREQPVNLAGSQIFSGFYLNELLMRLMERYDPHPQLFQRYELTLQLLGAGLEGEWALRIFERDLLDSLGYGLLLEQTADDKIIEPQLTYCYHLEHGPLLANTASGKGIFLQGATLLSLASGRLIDETNLAEAKRLMRAALGLYLGNKPLQSRELFRQGIAAGLYPAAADPNIEE